MANEPLEWIEEVVLETPIEGKPEHHLSDGVSVIGYGERAWPYWTLRLRPGRYRIARVVPSLIHPGDLNFPFFFAGTISKKYRVDPIRPPDRFAAFTQEAYDKGIIGQPPSVARWNDPVEFKVGSADTYYRFEGRIEKWEVNNPQALPADCNPWVTFVFDYHPDTFTTSITYKSWPAFGWDSSAPVKMAYNLDAQTIYFSVEGDSETDFRELVISVKYLGA